MKKNPDKFITLVCKNSHCKNMNVEYKVSLQDFYRPELGGYTFPQVLCKDCLWVMDSYAQWTIKDTINETQ